MTPGKDGLPGRTSGSGQLNGSKAKFNDVIEFYIKTSALAHQGALRNAAPQFTGMSLSEDDVNALVAFLMSLTEDYDDA